MHKILTMGLLIGMLIASNNAQASSIIFESLNQTGTYGEIRGQVINCSKQSLLEDTLIHIPGKSVATRLGHNGEFHLHFVPTGNHTLVLEVNGKDIGKVESVPVKESNLTQINSLNVCITEKDKKPEMETAFNSGKSRFRCPKGGFGCQSIWMQKAREAQNKEPVSDSAEATKPIQYVINSEYEMVRVR